MPRLDPSASLDSQQLATMRLNVFHHLFKIGIELSYNKCLLYPDSVKIFQIYCSNRDEAIIDNSFFCVLTFDGTLQICEKCKLKTNWKNRAGVKFGQ